jgi:hypothetical protein
VTNASRIRTGAGVEPPLRGRVVIAKRHRDEVNRNLGVVAGVLNAYSANLEQADASH